MANAAGENRLLTDEERQLVRWMLEHGSPEAKQFLPQLDLAQVTPWRCPCGCASINFAIEGHPTPSGTMQILADFIYGSEANLNGIFVFALNGTLAGLEVYGGTGEAPKCLPQAESLRPFPQAAAGKQPSERPG